VARRRTVNGERRTEDRSQETEDRRRRQKTPNPELRTPNPNDLHLLEQVHAGVVAGSVCISISIFAQTLALVALIPTALFWGPDRSGVSYLWRGKNLGAMESGMLFGCLCGGSGRNLQSGEGDFGRGGRNFAGGLPLRCVARLRGSRFSDCRGAHNSGKTGLDSCARNCSDGRQRWGRKRYRSR
jgi:hypothetical protein